MIFKKLVFLLACAVLWIFSPVSHAHSDDDCRNDWRPVTSFEEFEPLDFELQPDPFTVKGKLKLPVRYDWRKKCFRPKKNLPAAVILHGSSGVDFRGDFYARALNTAGIATFEIDMWEARGIASAADRPPLPLFNYPDAFGALSFLSEHPNIAPDRIGVLGFSWGGVIALASAEELYASQFGGDLRFAAHVAHYPICYAANQVEIPGSKFQDLTGAPILIQIGKLDDYDNGEDDYDNGSEPCYALKDSLAKGFQSTVEVIPYEGAYHAWDRLEVPFTAYDSFANRGLGGEVEVVPNVKLAYKARKVVVKFFRRHL